MKTFVVLWVVTTSHRPHSTANSKSSWTRGGVITVRIRTLRVVRPSFSDTVKRERSARARISKSGESWDGGLRDEPRPLAGSAGAPPPRQHVALIRKLPGRKCQRPRNLAVALHTSRTRRHRYRHAQQSLRASARVYVCAVRESVRVCAPCD